MQTRAAALAAAIVAALATGMGGCEQTATRDIDARSGGEGDIPPELRPYREASGDVFTPLETDEVAPPPADSPFATGGGSGGERSPGERPEDPGTGLRARDSWVVVITGVPGNTRSLGEQLVQRVRTEGGLRDAYLTERSGNLVVATGAFDEPGSESAQDTLRQVRGATVGGARPYAMAFLAPPSSSAIESGSNPAHDLRNAREQFGDGAVYTLQIGVYGRNDDRRPTPDEVSLFRETAENAVRELRGAGELAFYFHGSTRSTVTVGVFGESDHDASVRPPIESLRLQQTRERHPHNLLNGQGIMQSIRAADGGRRESMQSSSLVAIPR